VNTGDRSPHSLIQDTCVTCHMESTPPPPGYIQTATNHSFKARIDICGDCHTKTLNGAALQAGNEEKIQELSAALGRSLLNKLPAQFTLKDYTAHVYGGKSYDVKSNAVVINKDNVASMVPVEPHGQEGFTVKLKSAVQVTYAPTGEAAHSNSLTELSVQLGDFTTDGTKSIIGVTDPLVKAGWNYFLIEGDGSFGIHNPGFTKDVLEASIAALK
jgi:hypothetical protein